MLETVADIPEAFIIIRNTRDIGRAGSFRWTKFLSNSKELLTLILQTDR